MAPAIAALFFLAFLPRPGRAALAGAASASRDNAGRLCTLALVTRNATTDAPVNRDVRLCFAAGWGVGIDIGPLDIADGVGKEVVSLLATDLASGDAWSSDANGQQVDLRPRNSWLLGLEEVSSPELVEVFAINALAPFVLNARLTPLLAATAAGAGERRAFVVNVSAMEGKFYRHKTPHHPHTNMAKAALNMMTRTAGADLADRASVFMTAVDTGWINDENPRPKAERIASTGFQTPIDEVDAAARVLHPVFHGLSAAEPFRGVFLKDYRPSEW